VAEGAAAPAVCPKCGATSDKFAKMGEDDAKKMVASDRTNDIHMEMITLTMRLELLCDEGIKLNLDPACVDAFTKAKNEVWVIKQRAKAELAGHMGKGKW
jgi:hypothetical protein